MGNMESRWLKSAVLISIKLRHLKMFRLRFEISGICIGSMLRGVLCFYGEDAETALEYYSNI